MCATWNITYMSSTSHTYDKGYCSDYSHIYDKGYCPDYTIIQYIQPVIRLKVKGQQYSIKNIHSKYVNYFNISIYQSSLDQTQEGKIVLPFSVPITKYMYNILCNNISDITMILGSDLVCSR